MDVNPPKDRVELRLRLIAAGIISADAPVADDPWEEIDLPLASIQFSPIYQRNVRQAHVKKIATEFDWMYFDPPMVNWRESGEFYCMDGQHRILGCMERFGNDAHATCRLFYGLTVEQEARLFNAQDLRKALSPIERFKAGVVAGSEPYITINAIVEATGWAVAEGTGTKHDQGNGISSVATLMRIQRQYQRGHLGLTLEMLRMCFGVDQAPSGDLLQGFASFLHLYRDEYDANHLVKRMREASMSGVRSDAEKRRVLDRVRGYESVGMTIVAMYNARRKSDEWLDSWANASRRSRPGQSSQFQATPKPHVIRRVMRPHV